MASAARCRARVDRFQELAARLESIDDAESRASVAEGMIGAMLELYGEGLVRIFDALERRAGGRATELTRGRRRREPAADPRPLPGAARRAGRGGARQRAPVHGDARRRRRARRAWRGTSRTCGCSAAATAAPRRPRRWSSRSARRSTRPRPTSTGVEVEGLVEPRTVKKPLPLVGQDAAGADRPGSSCRTSPTSASARWRRRPWEACRCWSRTSAARCSPSATHARAAARRCTAPSSTDGLLTCPGCRAQFELPLAGRALGEDLQLAPVPLLRGRRPRQGRGPVIEGGGIRELRRRLDAPAARAAPARRGGGRGALRHVLGADPGRPPPPAARRGAA